MSWNKSPSEFVNDVEQALNKTVRQFVFVCYNNLVALSPVDTGRYRNAHHISMGGPSYAQSGETTISIPVGYYKPIYLQNNLPYVLRIENGWSKQAPTGVYQNAFHSAIESIKHE